MEEREKFWEDTPEEAEHRKKLEEWAKKVKERVYTESQLSTQKLINMPHDQFWNRWGKLSPKDPQNVTREPVNAMSGAIERGGGSKSGKKNKPKPHVKQFHTWENL